MIVTCTNCQSRFRVADEKIGPKGIKVRCSKCQTVFPVRREIEAEVPPAAAPGLPLPAAGPPPLPSPRGSMDLELDLGRPPPAPDTFAGPAPADPFAPRSDDPFAPPGGADPLRGAPSPPGRSSLADPWAVSSVPGGADGPGLSALPVTDLSDLAGGGPSPPSPAAPPDSPFGTMQGEGLSLEDRTTPPPLAAHGRGDLFGGFDSYGGGSGADLGESPFGSLDLGGAGSEPAPDLARPSGGPGAVLFEPAAALAASQAPARPAPARPPAPPPEAEVDLSERARRRRGAAVRSVAVNAVSLAVLLLAALALLVVLRGNTRLEARSFRPAALFGALGRREAGPVVATDVTNGLFERARGAPLLFVRGRVLSRLEGDLPAVRVRVEVVRDGTVLARGETWAGALPTPEELWAADDDAALDALAASLRARAARPVRPAQSVPFLVAITDYPADLSGASLRVTTAPEEAPARGSP